MLSKPWRLPSRSPVSRLARTTPPPPRTTYPASSTGRRLAFARWITDPSNPLTARVAVNHLWGRHFGRAIVPSVNDFGRNGQRPSHPALLDWLAAEFMETRLEHEGDPPPDRHERDLPPGLEARRRRTSPATRTTSSSGGGRPRRAEAEVVRDCLFAVAGSLDSTMGGPAIDHQAGLTVPRRSLYFQHAAEKQMEFLQIFDAAGVTECYRRKESILPQQALALANSDLSLRQARRLARTLSMRSRLRFLEFRDRRVRAGAHSRPHRSRTDRVPRFPRCRAPDWASASIAAVGPRRTTRKARLPRPTRPCGGAKAWSTCS